MTAEQLGAAGRLADWTNNPQGAFLSEASAARLNTHALRSRGAQRTNPTDFVVSLRARSGTDRQLHQPGERIQAMRGFEAGYTDIIDYIVRATHRAWEEKDVGYIYELYSHSCIVQDDVGLIFGRDRVIENTISLIAAFPDIRLIASEIVWAGDDEVGFHTSHRTLVIGTNTGWSAFGPPTGRQVQFWLTANCVAIANEIVQEHVIYNTSSLVRQLGLDVVETARRTARDLPAETFVYGSGEPQRLHGQGKPDHLPPPPPDFDPEDFTRRMLHYVWNWRMVGMTRDFFAPTMRYYGPTDRIIAELGDYQAHVMSTLAMFPDLALAVDDVYWMATPRTDFACRSAGLRQARIAGPASTGCQPGGGSIFGASVTTNSCRAASRLNGRCSTSSRCCSRFSADNYRRLDGVFRPTLQSGEA